MRHSVIKCRTFSGEWYIENLKLLSGNPDLVAQEIFAEEYEEFMQNKPNNIEVLFADAAHPQHNTIAAYG